MSNISFRSGEPKTPKFERWASPQSCTLIVRPRGRRQVGGHDQRGAAVEGERRGEHPPVADRDELGNPARGLLLEQRDRVGPVGRRLPARRGSTSAPGSRASFPRATRSSTVRCRLRLARRSRACHPRIVPRRSTLDGDPGVPCRRKTVWFRWGGGGGGVVVRGGSDRTAGRREIKVPLQAAHLVGVEDIEEEERRGSCGGEAREGRGGGRGGGGRRGGGGGGRGGGGRGGGRKRGGEGGGGGDGWEGGGGGGGGRDGGGRMVRWEGDGLGSSGDGRAGWMERAGRGWGGREGHGEE